MKRASWWTRLRYSYLAKPAEERTLYRAMLRRSVSKVVEIGLGDCQRSERLIRLATRLAGKQVTYTGIDTFETTPAGQPFLKYKDAYRRLNFSGCTIKLVPGDPLTALARVANTLVGTELLVIGRADLESMQAAWRYVPRMLSDSSRAFVLTATGSFRELPRSEVEQLAARSIEAARRAA